MVQKSPFHRRTYRWTDRQPWWNQYTSKTSLAGVYELIFNVDESLKNDPPGGQAPRKHQGTRWKVRKIIASLIKLVSKVSWGVTFSRPLVQNLMLNFDTCQLLTLKNNPWSHFKRWKMTRGVIFQRGHFLMLHRPMAFLSHSLYDTPWLAPHMNILFWGPGNFPVNYSNRDTHWNALNRYSIHFNFMADTGILWNNWSLPLAKINWHSATRPVILTSNVSKISPTLWSSYWTWLLPNFKLFPRIICNGCGMPAENTCPFRHLVPSLFGTCIWSNFWDQFSQTCNDSPDFSPCPLVLSRFYCNHLVWRSLLQPGLTFTKFQVVSMDHLQQVWHASRKHLPF